MGSIGAPEILLIFLAILLLFGAKRIPEIARGLGKGIREFKSATKEIADEIQDAGRIETPRKPVQHTAPRSTPSQTTQPDNTSASASATGTND